MPVENRQYDRTVERVKNFCGMLLALLTVVSGVAATVYGVYVIPDVDRRIDARVTICERAVEARWFKIENSINYIGVQNRVMMTSAQVAKADTLYRQMRQQRGDILP